MSQAVIFSKFCRLLTGVAVCTIATLSTDNFYPALAEHHKGDHARFPASACGFHIAQGEFAAAILDCNRALAGNPGDVKALSNRGSALLLSGKAKEALADFDAAILLRPADAQLHYNRGLSLARMGQRNAAIAAYSEALRINPRFAAAYYNRGFEYELIGNLAKAKTDYRRALEISPNLSPSRSRLKALDTNSKGAN